jgi:hypothetical protein
MNISDKLNFRGKFKQYDADGKLYLYLIGDAVDFNGKIYTAVRPTSNKVPGTLEGNNYWKEVGGDFNFFIQETPPQNAKPGDRWYVPSTSKLYTRIVEEGNRFWVEFSGNSTVYVSTTLITGASYAASIYDEYIGVSYGFTALIVLPENADDGKNVTVKDESGNAGDPYKYIIIRGATLSDKIDGQSSAIINIDNASLQFVYRNGWRII